MNLGVRLRASDRSDRDRWGHLGSLDPKPLLGASKKVERGAQGSCHNYTSLMILMRVDSGATQVALVVP